MGIMGGCFFSIIIGFSCFSWAIGFVHIKYELWNPRYDRLTSVGDVVTCYQAMMFGMFTVLALQSIFPAVVRALVLGKEVIDLIDR